MKIPESILVDPGDKNQVLPTIEKFFQDVQTDISERLKLEKGQSTHPYFDYHERELWIAHDKNSGGDERIKYLTLKDKIVATVIETRSEFNYVRYDFLINLENLEKTL